MKAQFDEKALMKENFKFIFDLAYRITALAVDDGSLTIDMPYDKAAIMGANAALKALNEKILKTTLTPDDYEKALIDFIKLDLNDYDTDT